MKLRGNDLEFEVREGTADDVPLLLEFIRSMAAYERLEVTASEVTLRESLFGESPAARTLLAFVDGAPAAYVVYFFSFATMVGKRGLWLDDLFVRPEFRGRGIARALMAHLAGLAVSHDCARFEWMVLDWNAPAIGFYRGLGATLLDDWRICRLEGQELARIAYDEGNHGGPT